MCVLDNQVRVCVCVSGLTVGLRLLYFGWAGHAPSTPNYYSWITHQLDIGTLLERRHN